MLPEPLKYLGLCSGVVTLANVFQPSTNVRKISVVDVVEDLDVSQYSDYKFL